jgi:hypothetical protein
MANNHSMANSSSSMDSNCSMVSSNPTHRLPISRATEPDMFVPFVSTPRKLFEVS